MVQQNRPGRTQMLVILPLLLLGGMGATVATSGIKTANSSTARTIGQLTITAKSDGTFDIAEIPDYWFGPTAVGGALDYAMTSRFGKSAHADQVDIVVKADAGTSDMAICTAIQSARSHGFSRFGFTDSRLRELAQHSVAVADAQQP